MMSRKRARSDSVSSVPTTDSPFRIAKLESTMSLSPAYIGRAHLGASELLNDRLLKYDSRFGGVMLSYSNLRVEDGFGMVFEDCPEIRYRFKYRALLFMASKGSRLTGRINQVSAGHISLLVFGAFPVSIIRERLKSRYEYKDLEGQFVSSQNKDDVLAVDTAVSFRVHAVDTTSPTDWFIEGTMADADLGPISQDGGAGFGGLPSFERVKKEDEESSSGAADSDIEERANKKVKTEFGEPKEKKSKKEKKEKKVKKEKKIKKEKV